MFLFYLSFLPFAKIVNSFNSFAVVNVWQGSEWASFFKKSFCWVLDVSLSSIALNSSSRLESTLQVVILVWRVQKKVLLVTKKTWNPRKSKSSFWSLFQLTLSYSQLENKTSAKIIYFYFLFTSCWRWKQVQNYNKKLIKRNSCIKK